MNLFKSFLHLVGGNIGQESQTSGVDSQYGNFLVAHQAGSFQESAVATDTEGHIRRKVIVTVENLQSCQVCTRMQAQELVKFPVNTDMVFLVPENLQQMGHVG